jgi:uncharacterized membrane protein YdjX (TVP38/TMEM64 family)
VSASVLAGRYENEIHVLVNEGGVMGVIGYIIITIVAVVIAPISTLPLIPIATAIWGWFWAGVFSIIGWTIGAQIAFYLAHRFGKSFIRRITSMERLKEIESRISTHHLFWTVVLLRMTIPVDVLSYALGLFSHMKRGAYFFSTLIGVTPFAFILAYTGTLPILYQIVFLSAGIFAALLWYALRRRRSLQDIKKHS